MIVVADTSPLNYLILIGQADLLYRLYGRVLIPQAVLSELQDPGAPSAIASWLKQCPPWLEICQVAIGREEISEKLDVGEAGLGSGRTIQTGRAPTHGRRDGSPRGAAS